MTDWINPETGQSSCPGCSGFGYLEDGTDEGQECGTCGGKGVATVEAADAFLEAQAVMLLATPRKWAASWQTLGGDYAVSWIPESFDSARDRLAESLARNIEMFRRRAELHDLDAESYELTLAELRALAEPESHWTRRAAMHEFCLTLSSPTENPTPYQWE